MRRAEGCLEISGPGPGARTRDLVVCGHCERAIPVKPGAATVQADVGEIDVAWCAGCAAFVCGQCKALATQQGRCLSFAAQVDRQLEAEARRRQTARALGLDT